MGQDQKIEKTFCVLPWIHMAVRSNGDFRVCCPTNQGPHMGLLQKEDGSNYNLAKDQINTHRNSELLKDIRFALMNGVRHPECIRCWREEDAGLTSRRLSENELWGDYFGIEEAKIVTNNETGEIRQSFEPFDYDLRFGNFCNLKCRICGPADSSSWYEDHVNLEGSMTYRDTHGRVYLERDEKGRLKTVNNDYDWAISEQFWSHLEEKIPYIRRIYLVGGEPLMINRHYDFLEKCVATNHSKQILLEYNTNLSILDDRIINIWKKFQRVQLGVSVDGHEFLNDYIRFPSRWSHVLNNLRRLDSVCGGNIQAWLATTISVFNVLYMPEFFTWHIREGFNNINKLKSRLPCSTFHMLHRPFYYNVKCFPREIKEIIAKKYRDFYKELPQLLGTHSQMITNQIIKNMDAILFFMNAEDLSEKYYNEFLQHTIKLDQIRNQSIVDFLPELTKLLELHAQEHTPEIFSH